MVRISDTKPYFAPIQSLSARLVEEEKIPSLVERVRSKEDLHNPRDGSIHLASVYFTKKENAENFKEELKFANLYEGIEIEYLGTVKDHYENIVKLAYEKSNNNSLNSEAFLGHQQIRKLI
jgi:hypothetical protein